MSETAIPAIATRGKRIDWTCAGFLVTAFAAVGLIGLFASFAAPLPLQREIMREATLDRVLTAPPTSAAAIADLRLDLDDSAPALIDANGAFRPDITVRVAAERSAMRARFAHEASAVAVRARWMVCIITAMASVFGIVIMGASRRT